MHNNLTMYELHVFFVILTLFLVLDCFLIYVFYVLIGYMNVLYQDFKINDFTNMSGKKWFMIITCSLAWYYWDTLP
jgi:hypothetical protein